ncbi:MAG: ABC transporter ATP-binding protein [Actinomycetota bacterium]
MAAIRVRGLKRYYGDVRAVDGVDLEVEEGEIFGILGPNGAGKTTTLEMIETLRDPEAGEIAVLGLDARRDHRKIRELIGVQLQTTVFFDELTVWETLDLFASFYPRALSPEELLELAELREKADSRVSTLSGGQHKRLSIALALVNDPRLVFLDEPTTGLDPQARRHIWGMTERLKGRGKTVVITTHYIEEAEALCDRVAIMDNGRIIAQGIPRNLVSAHLPESTIGFRLVPPLDVERLEDLAGVMKSGVDDGTYMVITTSPQETLMEIMALCRKEGVEIREVNMRRATLENVFLKLTGRTIRS